jgi:hypothetical protein
MPSLSAIGMTENYLFQRSRVLPDVREALTIAAVTSLPQAIAETHDAVCRET